MRPERKFKEGNIAGALNIPVEDLSDKTDELPEDQQIVAYWRGPFCVFADDAVELLRNKGLNPNTETKVFPRRLKA